MREKQNSFYRTKEDQLLIAAAPDLLVALEKLLHAKRHGQGLQAWWDIEEAAETAIAKAKGSD